MRNNGSSSAATGPEARAGGPTATFADVDIRAELHTRPRRPPNYEQESRALAVLAGEMAANPRNMLQKLAEVAADLCGAGTAGISLLDGDVVRWEAVAGAFANARGGTMPRTESPCGICIDEGTTQLMHLADRCFPALQAEPLFVETLLVPFHHNGSPVGTVWIVSHTSDRRFDAEDERIVSVLAQFASSAWQLWKSYEVARDSSARKSAFLALLGHELRNPLGAMTTAAALLRERHIEPDGSMRAVDMIVRQCQHMTRLVADLLDSARVENRKLELQKRRIDLRAVVTEAVDTRRNQIEQQHHELAIELGPDPILLDADHVRLVQVVSNLVDNAAKYTPAGGRITVAVMQSAAGAQIIVSDTGEGLPPEQLTNIFQPFTQLDARLRTTGGGLGLGLPLVRSITELHGGTVHATSAGLGKGSCFIVTLPTTPIPAPDTQARSLQFRRRREDAPR